MSVSPPARVLNLLKMGHPLSKVERWTGWPAHTIRRLAARQKWLINPNTGQAYDPSGVRLPSAVRLPNHPRISREEARALHARIKVRRLELGMTWVQVSIALGAGSSTLHRLAGGSGTTYTRDRAEAWLAQTTRIPTERQSA